MAHQHFDEAVDIEDAEEIESNLAPSPMPPRRNVRSGPQHKPGSVERGNTPPRALSDEDSEYDNGELDPKITPTNVAKTSTVFESRESEDESLASSDDESFEPKLEGAYDPAEFADLQVTPDVKEIFSFITKFSPTVQELETKLKPFIPDYIPAVGDIDAFIKIPPPDKKATMLGLDVVDEPCAAQSDSVVLDLQLRMASKATAAKKTVVKTLDNVDQNPKAIDAWISSITELHRQKPPPVVHYSSKMPDIEALMQEWPPEFEALLNEAQLPDASLDVSLTEYVDTMCALLDIPVQKSRIQALHLIFSLFLEFKTIQHFRTLDNEALVEGLGPSSLPADHTNNNNTSLEADS